VSLHRRFSLPRWLHCDFVFSAASAGSPSTAHKAVPINAAKQMPRKLARTAGSAVRFFHLFHGIASAPVPSRQFPSRASVGRLCQPVKFRRIPAVCVAAGLPRPASFFTQASTFDSNFYFRFLSHGTNRLRIHRTSPAPAGHTLSRLFGQQHHNV